MHICHMCFELLLEKYGWKMPRIWSLLIRHIRFELFYQKIWLENASYLKFVHLSHVLRALLSENLAEKVFVFEVCGLFNQGLQTLPTKILTNFHINFSLFFHINFSTHSQKLISIYFFNWIKYDRGDSFSFNFEPNRIAISRAHSEKCIFISISHINFSHILTKIHFHLFSNWIRPFDKINYDLLIKFIHPRFFIYSSKVCFSCTTNSEPYTIKTNLGWIHFLYV